MLECGRQLSLILELYLVFVKFQLFLWLFRADVSMWSRLVRVTRTVGGTLNPWS